MQDYVDILQSLVNPNDDYHNQSKVFNNDMTTTTKEITTTINNYNNNNNNNDLYGADDKVTVFFNFNCS